MTTSPASKETAHEGESRHAERHRRSGHGFQCAARLARRFWRRQRILRPAHVVWLDGLATFLRRRAFPPTKGKWVITITGRASKTGSDYHNRRLSERRCSVVRKHLANKLVGVSIEFAPTYLGEASPFNTKINENARDRSVEVFVVASVAPIRIDPDPPGGAERTKVFDLVVSEFLVHTIGSPVMTLPIGWCWWKMNLTVTDPDTDDIEIVLLRRRRCVSHQRTRHGAWRGLVPIGQDWQAPALRRIIET